MGESSRTKTCGMVGFCYIIPAKLYVFLSFSFFRMKLLSDQGITSQATLLSKSAEQTLEAVRVARPGLTAEEEEALRRLLRARLAGEEGERSEVDCLRGCGARVRADRVRRHNCVRDLRREVDARLRMFNVGQLERDVAQIKREFVEDRGGYFLCPVTRSSILYFRLHQL